ncbi:Detected protein of confused Function [Hibiscus syriacus]|uniref:Detected protein of confused Function n=1 Tax=Hibiscus syriacus TaxID=106335 RepID=A0A6A2Z320_HIBSY|nr:Detected protein of confused Function [Hibiscus syriacus]
MMKICLMVSHGYPQGPGLVLHQEQGIRIKIGSFDLRSNRFLEQTKPVTALHRPKLIIDVDPMLRKPVMINKPELLGFGIAEKCTRHEKILNPEKIKLKPSPKKGSKKLGRDRDLYKKNFFHACECLISLMVDKRRQGRTAVLSLRKSEPELPQLLTQFSASIAGAGLAVLFSAIFKVACGRVPFGTSKLFSTGLAFGLVWLSRAVNRLRDMVVHISKNTSKSDPEEEEMIKCNVDLGRRYLKNRGSWRDNGTLTYMLPNGGLMMTLSTYEDLISAACFPGRTIEMPPSKSTVALACRHTPLPRIGRTTSRFQVFAIAYAVGRNRCFSFTICLKLVVDVFGSVNHLAAPGRARTSTITEDVKKLSSIHGAIQFNTKCRRASASKAKSSSLTCPRSMSNMLILIQSNRSS